jgi:hypothetical protein
VIRPVDPSEHEAQDEREIAPPLLRQERQQSPAGVSVVRMWDADRDDQERDREREHAVAERANTTEGGVARVVVNHGVTKNTAPVSGGGTDG